MGVAAVFHCVPSYFQHHSILHHRKREILERAVAMNPAPMFRKSSKQQKKQQKKQHVALAVM
jgi:hypothetical protein